MAKLNMNFLNIDRCIIIARAVLSRDSRNNFRESLELVDVAASCNADFIHFDFNLQNNKNPLEDIFTIHERAKSNKIRLLLTPKDHEEIDFFIRELKLEFIEIDLENQPDDNFFKSAIRKQVPLFLRTNLSNQDMANQFLKTFSTETPVPSLSSAMSQYLAIIQEQDRSKPNTTNLKLDALLNFSKKFPIRIGFQDNAIGDEISIAGVAKGISIISRYLAVDPEIIEMKKFALSASRFDSFCRSVKRTEAAFECPKILFNPHQFIDQI